MIVPRPLVVVNGATDVNFPIESAKEQVEIAQVVYEAAGTKGNIRHVIGLEGRRFYAAQFWPVFDEVTGWQ